MKKFLRNEEGMSAIEFALVAPLLAAVLVGIVSSWDYMKQQQDMRDGVEAGAKYVVQGGRDTTKAHDIAMSAWTNKPVDADIEVTQLCTCNGASASCGSVCSDSTIPQSYITIEASTAYYDTSPYGADPVAITTKEVIRVR
jgi:Flp pilus assembly protein TadG